MQPSTWISNNEIIAFTNPNNLTSWEINIFKNSSVNQNNSIGELFIRRVGYTRSMEPIMFGGNKLIALEVKNKDLINPGDIIGFRIEDGIIMHRVVTKEYEWNETELIFEPFFRTKGDNLSRIDPWIVKSDDIIGVVVGILY